MQLVEVRDAPDGLGTRHSMRSTFGVGPPRLADDEVLLTASHGPAAAVADSSIVVAVAGVDAEPSVDTNMGNQDARIPPVGEREAGAQRGNPHGLDGKPGRPR